MCGRLKTPTPQEFEIRLKDKENTKEGYVMTTDYGTESEFGARLKGAGMKEPDIDRLFKQVT